MWGWRRGNVPGFHPGVTSSILVPHTNFMKEIMMEKFIYVVVTPESTEADPCRVYNRAFYSYAKSVEYMKEIERTTDCPMRILDIPLEELEGGGGIING
jgi:hypothetical protein